MLEKLGERLEELANTPIKLRGGEEILPEIDEELVRKAIGQEWEVIELGDYRVSEIFDCDAHIFLLRSEDLRLYLLVVTAESGPMGVQVSHQLVPISL